MNSSKRKKSTQFISGRRGFLKGSTAGLVGTIVTVGLGTAPGAQAVPSDGTEETDSGLVTGISTTAKPRGVELYERAELFLNDDYLVAESRGIRVEPAKARKHPGNPILVPDRSWESGYFAYCTMVQDVEEGLYKLWYEVRNGDWSRLLYAVSKDGLQWEKPTLNVVEFEGSRANNIVYQGSWAKTSTKVYHVTKDYSDSDPGKRYKMMYQFGDFRGLGIAIGYSPDGIRWTASKYVNLFVDNDTQNIFFFDDRVGQYVGYFRHWLGGNRRHVARGVSYDGFRWSIPVWVHGPDFADPPGRDLYTPGVFKYSKGTNVYVMVTSMFDQVISDMPAPQDANDWKMHGQLGVSRDGIHWHRFREPFLPYGKEGSWDSGGPVAAAAEASVGGQTAIYYGQSSYWFFGNAGEAEKQPPGHGGGGRPGIGVAFVPEGGFVGWRAEREGMLTTQPLVLVDVVEQDDICVNAEAAGGSIRAELLDESGKVIPGFSRDKSHEVHENGNMLPLRWEGQQYGKGTTQSSLQLLSLQGAVRLKLYLSNATVYGLKRLNPTH